MIRLMVDTHEGRKAMASWRRPPGRPRNVWLDNVQEDANVMPLSIRCGDPRSLGVHGAAQRSIRTTRRYSRKCPCRACVYAEGVS